MRGELAPPWMLCTPLWPIYPRALRRATFDLPPVGGGWVPFFAAGRLTGPRAPGRTVA